MNNFTIIFTESYVRRARKFFKAHPELLGQYEKCLLLMEANPFHPSLRIEIGVKSRVDLNLLVD